VTAVFSSTVNCAAFTVTTTTNVTPTGITGSGIYYYVVTNATPTASPLTYGTVTTSGLCQPDSSAANAITVITMAYIGTTLYPVNCQSATAALVAAGSILASQGATGAPIAATAAQIVAAIGATAVANATLASTASALAATPSQCAGLQFATGIAASGNANCGTPTGSILSCTASGVSLTTSPTTLSQCAFSAVTLPSGSCHEIKGVTTTTANSQLVILAGATAISKQTIGNNPYTLFFDTMICNTGTALTVSPLMGGDVLNSGYPGATPTPLIADNLSTGGGTYPFSLSFTWGTSQNISVTFASTTGSGTGSMSMMIF